MNWEWLRLRWEGALVGLAIALALTMCSGCSLDAPVKERLVYVGDVAKKFDDAAFVGVVSAATGSRAALAAKGAESADVGLSLRVKAHELAETLTASAAEEAAREYAGALRALDAELAKVDNAVAAGAALRSEASRIRKAADEVLKRSESFTWDDLADILGGLKEEVPDGR